MRLLFCLQPKMIQRCLQSFIFVLFFFLGIRVYMYTRNLEAKNRLWKTYVGKQQRNEGQMHWIEME